MDFLVLLLMTHGGGNAGGFEASYQHIGVYTYGAFLV